ncbi:MAG: hypothetical protein R3F62_20035 [Planctomycetota bacterium]
MKVGGLLPAFWVAERCSRKPVLVYGAEDGEPPFLLEDADGAWPDRSVRRRGPRPGESPPARALRLGPPFLLLDAQGNVALKPPGLSVHGPRRWTG